MPVTADTDITIKPSTNMSWIDAGVNAAESEFDDTSYGLCDNVFG